MPDLPPMEAGADAPALGVLTEYAAGAPPLAEAQPLTVRGVIRRNAAQDLRLAATLDPEVAGPDVLARRAIDLVWQGQIPAPLWGPEWYLRLRDFLYRQFDSP